MYQEIYLTGFKKFQGVDVNPTQLIIDEIVKNPIHNVYPTKLDVIADQVDHFIQQMKKHQCQSNKRILNIHFGVGPNKEYKLQNCAYNNKDFRIPDNSGKICTKQKICHKLQFDQSLDTGLNLKQLVQKLNNQTHHTFISTDPGRYLCNYVYFSSLFELKCDRDNVDCLFVHFPPLAVTTHEQNMLFVKDLIKELLLQK